MPETSDSLYAARPYAERLICSGVTIRRTRMLAQPGQVTRRTGDRVASDQVVAETDVAQGYRLLEIDKALRVRAARARKAMVRRIGDVVEQGEVIARTGGLFKKEFASPVAGQIVDIQDTRVLIEAVPQSVALLALYPGQVVELIPDRGVVIESTGTLVQGAWGCGRELRTTLTSVAQGNDVPLLVGQITGEHTGTVMLGGRTLDAGVIAQAADNRVRGLIVGSVRSDLIPIIAESGVSIIVTEGFGDIPMHAEAFRLLQACAGQDICFQPSTRVGWKTQRPEVFCFSFDQDRPALIAASETLNVGARARVLRAPYSDAVGEIVTLPGRPRRLASGITAWCAQVRLESGDTVYVPLENLEIIR